MSELKLLSPFKKDIKPIVEATLQNEMRLLEAGIKKTELNLNKFENKYNMNTDSFISAYENDEVGETIEFSEWIGEIRMLEKLRDKSDILKSIKFAN